MDDIVHGGGCLVLSAVHFDLAREAKRIGYRRAAAGYCVTCIVYALLGAVILWPKPAL
jgi:hypothetical protein